MLSTIFDSGECPSVRDHWYATRQKVRTWIRDGMDPVVALGVFWTQTDCAPAWFGKPRDRLQWRVYHRGPFVPLKTLRERLRGNGLPIAGPKGKLP